MPSGCLEPLRYLFVAEGVARPPRRSAPPAVILDRQVDAAVDKELHPLTRVRQEDEMVQDARGLVRVPVGADVGAVCEQEVRHVEMTVDDGPGERGVENLLHADLIPRSPPARGWSLTSEVAQFRLALRVEPALHAGEVAHARRMGKVVWYWPDAREEWEELRCRVGQCLFDVLRRRWRLAPQYGRMEVE